MQTVREGLATGTRLVGTPSAKILFQLCKNPSMGQTERRAEN